MTIARNNTVDTLYTAWRMDIGDISRSKDLLSTDMGKYMWIKRTGAGISDFKNEITNRALKWKISKMEKWISHYDNRYI